MSPVLFPTGRLCLLENCVIPDVVQRFSGVKVELWHWLEEEIGNQNGPFELNQSALADEFGVSRKSIQNALKTFVSANLLEKVESRTGRGNHSLYSLIWTFREETGKSATPSRVECTTPRKIQTKGRWWRYFAYKFRTTVENSSLASKSQVVVGKILNFLKNKPQKLFQAWLTRLKRWLNGPPTEKTIKDFFVFFHNGLMEIYRSKMGVIRTEQKIADQREQRKKVREEYQSNPPPRLSDCGSFADYQKAVKDWDSGNPKEDGTREADLSTCKLPTR